MKPLRMALAVLVVALSGCGTSPPPRYFALDVAAQPQPSGSAQMLVEILPVVVPERLNRAEMVLTGAAGQLDVRDGDLWAAPLSDEIRQVLTDTLWRRLRAADDYQAPVAPVQGGQPQYRLALRVERFDAAVGGSAVVEGSWSARRLPGGRSATCWASLVVPLSGVTPAAAAAALSDATGQLAVQVADSLANQDRDGAPLCPPASR